MRLNQFIAHAGICSRRKADDLIKSGKISVNDQVITAMGYTLKEDDVVKHEGQVLTPEKKVYVLLNKPKGYITTTSDEEDRKTVLDIVMPQVKRAAKNMDIRIYPVGRLDRNTTGLLLITNDGELTQALTHPSYEVAKIYMVTVDRPLAIEDFEKIKVGFELEDGFIKVDEVAYPDPRDKTKIGVALHSGKNRIVRRIFEFCGYEVKKLDRVMYAGLTKKDLPRGKWRFLLEKEIIRLKYFSSNRMSNIKINPAPTEHAKKGGFKKPFNKTSGGGGYQKPLNTSRSNEKSGNFSRRTEHIPLERKLSDRKPMLRPRRDNDPSSNKEW
jgi:23S rRNA pseudouridine2605 synthase